MSPDAAEGNEAPSNATSAVLKPSEPVPSDARQVEGIEFNNFSKDKLTVEELVHQMARMGFQATSVGEATRIINEMASAGIVVVHHSQTNGIEVLERRGNV